MKFYLISDNIDTQMGMRLSGIKGIVVHTKEDTLNALKNAEKDKSIAVVLITPILYNLCEEELIAFQQTHTSPIIYQVPDRHAKKEAHSSVARIVKETVGINIEE